MKNVIKKINENDFAPSDIEIPENPKQKTDFLPPSDKFCPKDAFNI